MDTEASNGPGERTFTAELLTELNALATDTPGGKVRLLTDLAELLNRHRYHGGSNGNFTFMNQKIGNLPDRLTEAEVRGIAQRVGPLLIDALGSAQLRASAAFVLGKTDCTEALNSIVHAVTGADQLPAVVVRQCAYAYDALTQTCAPADTTIVPEIVGRHFMSYGIPWDTDRHEILVDEL